MAAPHANLTPEILELLQQAPGAPIYGPPNGRRIYVNRNLRMDQMDWIGFDMDYTIAIYNQPELERLSIELTIQKMIERKHYPPEIAKLDFDRRYAIRGLVVDRKLGNLLKVDRYGHVGRGYHGTRKLDKEERAALYRSQARTRLRSPRFAWIDTLFALPEATMYTALIDYLEPRNPALSFDQLWQDVRECIDEAHRDDTLKTVIKAEMARYILPDPDLPQALHKLRSAGKRLFLLTNSLYDYTDAVMRFLLDGKLPAYPSWRNYFDQIIVGGAKPAFFTDQRPFQELDLQGNVLQAEVRGPLQRGHIYQGGNLADLQSSLGQTGDRVLYVGDHIYGDMLRSKKSSNWRTAMVVQELEEELETRDRLKDRIDALEAVTRRLAELDADINFQQMVLKTLQKLQDHQLADRERVETARRTARAELDELRTQLKDTLARHVTLRREIDSTFHPIWGQLFREGNENSRFGEQVEDYACLYTSRVSNFLAYSPLQYFRAPRDYMPHELV